MKQILLLIFICSLGTINGLAQDARLRGQLSGADDQTPLISATVSATSNGKTIGTVTDFEGAYELQLAAGTYELTFAYIGYESVQQNITLHAGETRTIDLALRPVTTLLQTATVTSGRYEKPLSDVTVSLEVIKPNLIESVNSTSIDEVLEKVPGVTIVDGQANIRGGSGYSYGAGSRVLLMVDDIPILAGDSGSSNWDDIPVENIAQVEVIKGAASALYGSSALNGIINVRTGYAKSKPET
ncbi:MAG: TonB-dependent receptor plug domain-containing protein [Bacteroidota bacterium]